MVAVASQLRPCTENAVCRQTLNVSLSSPGTTFYLGQRDQLAISYILKAQRSLKSVLGLENYLP